MGNKQATNDNQTRWNGNMLAASGNYLQHQSKFVNNYNVRHGISRESAFLPLEKTFDVSVQYLRRKLFSKRREKKNIDESSCHRMTSLPFEITSSIEQLQKDSFSCDQKEIKTFLNKPSVASDDLRSTVLIDLNIKSNEVKNTKIQEHTTFEHFLAKSKKRSKNVLANPWIVHSSFSVLNTSNSPQQFRGPSPDKDIQRHKDFLLANKFGDAKDECSSVFDLHEVHEEAEIKADDLNSYSEGYYSSSLSSLSGIYLESPGPIPYKNLVSNIDSGFYSFYNSCNDNSFISSYESSQDSESDESDEMEGSLYATLPFEQDVMLPCSRDLIAMNKLLRKKYLQRCQAEHHNKDNCIRNDNKEDNFAGAKSQKEEWSGSNEPLLKFNYEGEKNIYLVEHDFYDNVFCETGGKHAIIGPPVLLIEEQVLSFPRAEMNSSRGDGIDGCISDLEQFEVLEKIRSSLEKSHIELLTQKRKVNDVVERLRAEEKIRKNHLKILREGEFGNKKKFFLQTLHRLKQCLDQQKTWLQSTYDNILERKWPILHQMKH